MSTPIRTLVLLTALTTACTLFDDLELNRPPTDDIGDTTPDELCGGDAECASDNCSNDHCAPVAVIGESEVRFAYVPAGTFWMGSPAGCPGPFGYPGECESELRRQSDEVLHEVTLTGAFFMQPHEVTQGEWLELMGNSPSSHSACDDCPVETVNWWEAVAYVNALSALEDLDPCYTLVEPCNAEDRCDEEPSCSFLAVLPREDQSDLRDGHRGL